MLKCLLNILFFYWAHLPRSSWYFSVSDQPESIFHSSLFAFPVSYWLNELVFPVSSGGRTSSSCNSIEVSITMSAFSWHQEKSASVDMLIGTVARDFWPLICLVNRPHMDSRFTLETIFDFGFDLAKIFEKVFSSTMSVTTLSQNKFQVR